MDAVVFDLGKVLLDWNPRYYYRQFFASEEAMDAFLSEALPPAWVIEMDAGKPADVAIAERQRLLPQYAALIGRWKEGWNAMLRGPIAESVAILAELRVRDTRLYALTNFSTETWPVARERFDFLSWFEDTVVSGEHGVVKPDPRIFEIAIRRFRLDPPRTVFIDDLAENVAAARKIGFRALHFTGAPGLRADLRELGLLD
ncbi:MAG TPA: HAD family phosphatase [Burkholderiales bacterium]